VRRSFLIGLRAASLVAASACGAATASSETLIAHYSVKLIGLPLGTASVAGRFDGASYHVEAAAKLTGVASLVANSKGAATASGTFVQGRVAPNGYATTSSNSKITRTIRIGMNAGVVRGEEISPPFDEAPGRIPVTEAQKRNIIDPLSALVMPVKGSDSVVGPAACDRSIPIYDGWTRFDVNLSYVGARNVNVRGYNGPVAVCAARYVPISGHRPDRPATKFMADNRNMEVWLAPVGVSRIVVPLRISVATMVGSTVIEAIEFSVDGAKAAQR
jgi:Protein of unknown function (DUF3108)